MSRRDKEDFGRFLYTVTVVGLVVTVLGLAAIWYYFNYGSLPLPAVTPTQRSSAGRAALSPNQVMLYYTRDGRTLTGTVLELSAGIVTPNDRAREIVTSLLEGKGAIGLRTPLPAETKLRSIFVTNGLAVVNLSREFVNNFQGGPDQELVAVYSLVNSLLFNIEGIDGIQILVEGERLPTLRGTVDIEQPLVANQAITRSL